MGSRQQRLDILVTPNLETYRNTSRHESELTAVSIGSTRQTRHTSADLVSCSHPTVAKDGINCGAPISLR